MRNHLNWLFLLIFGIALIGCQDDINVNSPIDKQEGSGLSLNKTSVAIETLTKDLDVTGSKILVAGVGTLETGFQGTGTINLTVPIGFTIKKVFLYWGSRHHSSSTLFDTGDPQITVNNTPIDGELIGKAALDAPRRAIVRRADVTGVGAINTGSNTFTLNIKDFQYSTGLAEGESNYVIDRPDGVGLIVIVDDGTNSLIEIRDGADFAYLFADPLYPQSKDAVPQTFNFSPAAVKRFAELSLFVGDVDYPRPSSLKITVGDLAPVIINNPFQNNTGPQWDVYFKSVEIPVGVNKVTVEPISGPGNNAASLYWLTAALSVPQPLAEVGDRIWNDLDKDGIQDGGEPGFPKVHVCLYSCDPNAPDNGWLGKCMETDDNGNYLFKDLQPGSYKVRMNIPTGWSLSPQNVGVNDAIDSDFLPAIDNKPYTECFELSPGESDLTWDGGLYLTSSQLNKLGDFVWHDKNVNGIQDTGEPGIAGVKIELLSGNTVIKTTTTDDNGKYLFTDLANGNYCVRVAASNYEVGGVFYNTAQTKWYNTKKNQGSDDAKDSDANKNESACVDLNNNDNFTLDFGFYKTCVSVTKLADKKTAKPGETITYTFVVENCGDITLSGGVDLYDKMLNTIAPHKIANITPVHPGTTKSITKTYCVKADDCGDLVNTVKAVGHPIDGSANVEFSASVTVKIDCPPALSKLGDRVWLDGDKDGYQDAGGSGVKGVKVELYDCANKLLATTYTNYYGLYYFTNLTAGDYKVKFVAPTGYGFTKQDQGTNDEKDSDADPTTGFTKCITLGSGVTDLKWDAGLYCLPLSKLGDRVWKDIDKDGKLDYNEYGIKDVIVKLYDCNGNYIKSTTTDYYGYYYFSNLKAGDYKVKFVAPYGYAFTMKDQGTNDSYDSDVDPTTGYTTCITLGAGVNDLKWDAGLYKKW